MRHLKNRIEINVFVFLLTIIMVNPGVAVGAGSDRIYPTQKVTIYDGDKKVGVYTREAPFPEGATISMSARVKRADSPTTFGSDSDVILNLAVSVGGALTDHR